MHLHVLCHGRKRCKVVTEVAKVFGKLRCPLSVAEKFFGPGRGSLVLQGDEIMVVASYLGEAWGSTAGLISG